MRHAGRDGTEREKQSPDQTTTPQRRGRAETNRSTNPRTAARRDSAAASRAREEDSETARAGGRRIETPAADRIIKIRGNGHLLRTHARTEPN